MTWSVDGPKVSGTARIYALCERECRFWPRGDKLVGHGSKRPVFIILAVGDILSGLDMAGRQVGEADIERRFPGALARVLALE